MRAWGRWAGLSALDHARLAERRRPILAEAHPRGDHDERVVLADCLRGLHPLDREGAAIQDAHVRGAHLVRVVKRGVPAAALPAGAYDATVDD